MCTKYLSHPLADKNPGYGDMEAALVRKKLRDIQAGDGCNVSEITIQNHWGTHVDAPNHFFADGAKIVDYPASTWLFDKPQVISYAACPGEFILPEVILSTINAHCDLLIIQTGWTKMRGTYEYSFAGPGLSPELGEAIRRQYPHVRAVGVETTSISSMSDRERGRAAHRAFLDPAEQGKPLLLFEGMKLPEDCSLLRKVIALPLMVENLDAAPVTIIGIFEEDECY